MTETGARTRNFHWEAAKAVRTPAQSGRGTTRCPVCGAPVTDGGALVYDAASRVVIGCGACTFTRVV